MCGEDLQCRRRAGVRRVVRAWVCGAGAVGLPKLIEPFFSKFSWLSSEEARLQLCPKASLGLSPTPDATSELMTPPSM